MLQGPIQSCTSTKEGGFIERSACLQFCLNRGIWRGGHFQYILYKHKSLMKCGVHCVVYGVLYVFVWVKHSILTASLLKPSTDSSCLATPIVGIPESTPT